MKNEGRTLAVTVAVLCAGLAQAQVVVIDDGDTGFSTTGAWISEAAYNTYNNDILYQSSPNNGATATWAFTNLAAGKYYIAASWKNQNNLTQAAQYTVDGILAATINQRLSASFGFDDDVYEAGYARLSNFNGYVPVVISDGDVSVTATHSAGGYLFADSVRVETARPDVEKVYVIDNEDTSGYSETGVWYSWGKGPKIHRSNFRYTSVATNTATFNFSGLDDGVYRLSAAYTFGGNLPAGVSYTVSGGGSVVVDQRIAPSDDVFEESNWKDLFYALDVTGGSLSVTVSNTLAGGGKDLMADAMRLEKLDTVYKSRFALVDNFEDHTFGFDISSNKNWSAYNRETIPVSSIVSNSTGQAAQVLGSNTSGYNIKLGINTIPDGATGTLFLRTRSYSASVFSIGVYATDWDWSSGNWWDHDQAGFYGKSGHGDGTSMRPHYNRGNIQDIAGATWYNVWLVMDNAADTFDLYISQGQDPAVGFPTSTLVESNVAYRTAAGDIKYFFIAGSDDNPAVGGLIDDIYVAPGENLMLPAPLRAPIYPQGTIILIQ